MADLDISVQVSTPSGWLEINDRTIYELAKESFGDVSVSKRATKATNQFLEGEFTVQALREQVMEHLAVYVRSSNQFLMEANLRILTDAFDQPYYRIIRHIEGSWQVWFAGSAGYRIETSVEFLHAKMAKVTFEVPRHPVTELTAVAPT